MSELDFKTIFLNFTSKNFENTEPYTEKLKDLHQKYQNELHAPGGGCGACKKRRITNKYRELVKKLLTSEG